ncbi:hypothetical protein K466DRAFT_590649 [Polyporus arcularius HHB13444]|uniref:Uncharacterized protein n=1 Tax=Polyporus arcularius HHB13444 TaxID=1314778 RepID=A0A5C3NXU7_9APHY|nr:hypothetical protein K466DRAFT_590649 [Polyporus arcularius HHB13444]
MPSLTLANLRARAPLSSAVSSQAAFSFFLALSIPPSPSEPSPAALQGQFRNLHARSQTSRSQRTPDPTLESAFTTVSPATPRSGLSGPPAK